MGADAWCMRCVPRGYCINPKRVHRLMREEGLRGVRKGRFVPRTTDS